LAGVLLGIVYWKTRALWMPSALHVAWNWSLALWGLPISGVEIGKMPWEAEIAGGPVWLSGGDYGPEGGVIATLVLGAAVGLLLMRGGIDPPRTVVLPSTEPGAGPDFNNPTASNSSSRLSLHPSLS
jgi:hypothetical protein